MAEYDPFRFHGFHGFFDVYAASREKEPKVRPSPSGAQFALAALAAIPGVVKQPVADLDFERRCEIDQVVVVVNERGSYFDILDFKRFFGSGETAVRLPVRTALPPVRSAVVVEKIRDDGFPGGVNRIVELRLIMVAVVVGDQREVQKRR